MDDTLNVSDISFDGICLPTSTPKKQKANNGPANFKVPAVPTKKTSKRSTARNSKKSAKKSKAKCSTCGKEYICLRSFKKHRMAHAIEGAASRFPDGPKIKENLVNIAAATLKRMEETYPQFGPVYELLEQCIKISAIDFSGNWELFCLKVCDYFIKAIIKKKFLLPSALLGTLTKAADSYLSDMCVRDNLVSVLSSFCSDRDAVHCFVCRFVLCFCEQLLIYIRICVCGEAQHFEKHCVKFDEEDHTLIYFIGGSTMRAFFRMAKNYPECSTWQDIKCTIVCRVLTTYPALVQPATPALKEWTSKQDRGSLLYLGKDGSEFFISLAEIIGQTIKPSGCIPYIEVYKQVCSSSRSIYHWDRMISEMLPEKTSLVFLKSTVKYFCQTFGVGYSRKIINKLKEKPEASMNFRHSVARRKTSK